MNRKVKLVDLAKVAGLSFTIFVTILTILEIINLLNVVAIAIVSVALSYILLWLEIKGEKSKLKEYEKKAPTLFEFPRTSLTLKIIEPESFLTWHKLTRRIKNVSDKPIETHFCYIYGDVERRWEDLNLNVYDEEGKKLDVIEVNMDGPFRKEFTVKLGKIVYPLDIYEYTIEWTWEESKRYFEYRFATPSNEFDFSILFPKLVDINLRIYEVRVETRRKTPSSRKPQLSSAPDGYTCLKWNITDIGINRIFRFEL